MRLVHVGLCCRSEENADRFYAGILGLQKQEPKVLAGSISKQIFGLALEREFRIVNYLDDNLHFEIFIDDHHIIDRERIAHVSIKVEDLGRFLDQCRLSDVVIRQVPKGDKIVTFVGDFDGNLFEVS